MLDYSTKQSLIVSAVVGENDDTTTDESAFFEIPLDDGMKEIEVSVLKSTTPAESPEIPPSHEDQAQDDLGSLGDDDDDNVYDDTINLLQTSEALRHLAGSRRSSDSTNGLGNTSNTSLQMAGTPPLPEKPKQLSQHSQPDLNLNTSGGSRRVADPKYDNIAPGLPVVQQPTEGRRMVPIPQVSEEEDPG